jgi:DNA processing protein
MTRDPGLAAWLQVTLAPGISASALRALLKRFGLPEAILRQPRSALSAYVTDSALKSLHSAETNNRVAAALAWADHESHAIVTLADDLYPRGLLECGDPPALLYALGRTELLNAPSLAIVGSRNATPQGRRDAEQFAEAFSRAGLTIVSGLALGIDAAGHRGGLRGRGSTIAVLGTGVDVAYPRSNAALALEIAERGLLLSEFPLGTPALAHHFPRRNRVISGLSRGCLVVEAAIASGSLITARMAAEQGRDVFAVPGSIHSPVSRGCHALIKSGAKLVESAEDVLSELSLASPASGASRPGPAASGHPLLECMGPDPIDIDSISLRSGRDTQAVATELLKLELAGLVAALPGGLYQRLNG